MNKFFIGLVSGVLLGAGTQALTTFSKSGNDKFKTGTFACITNPADASVIKLKVLGTHNFLQGTGVWVVMENNKDMAIVPETALSVCQ